MSNEKSSCCQAQLKTNSSDEGTHFYYCEKCQMACDVYTEKHGIIGNIYENPEILN